MKRVEATDTGLCVCLCVSQVRPMSEYVANILSTKQTIEEKVASSQLKLFVDSEPIRIDDE
jgi:hypothetical protein